MGKEFHNKFLKNVKSPHHALPPPLPPPHTAFTLMGNVVPFQLIRGRDIWSHMVHFLMEIDRSSFCDRRFYRFLQLNDHLNGFDC